MLSSCSFFKSTEEVLVVLLQNLMVSLQEYPHKNITKSKVTDNYCPWKAYKLLWFLYCSLLNDIKNKVLIFYG